MRKRRADPLSAPLPSRVAALIDRVLGDSKAAKEAQRERIKAALAEYPDEGHNKIAGRLGVSNHYVTDICEQEVGGDPTSCRHGLKGQGARKDRRRGAQPARRVVTPEIQEQITEFVAEHGASVREIAVRITAAHRDPAPRQSRAVTV